MKSFVIFLMVLSAPILISSQNLEVDGIAKITEMDTVIDAASNVVIKVDGTLAVRHYQVGNYAHGGIVFWVDETGEHGLVCDTADISTGIQWYNDIHKVTNATGDGVGAGEMNTLLIIAQQTVDNPSGDFAALKCSKLIRGPYGDWYLPSKEELNLMYLNRSIIDAAAQAIGGESFANDDYWSSTEYNETNAWRQGFYNGNQNPNFKAIIAYHIRAIRAF